MTSKTTKYVAINDFKRHLNLTDVRASGPKYLAKNLSTTISIFHSLSNGSTATRKKTHAY